jgi:iron-sulfur cluster repair protein YtfE (RIC family)
MPQPDPATPDLDLTRRDGLPEALRVLAERHPRADWRGHPNFGELVRFWMERHVMFRELMARLRTETQGFLDAKTELAAYAPRLSRYGGTFLNQLHGHHQIEDMHYFPQLIGLEPRIAAGFDLLERDHEAIDPMLQDFAASANKVLQAPGAGAAREAAGAFHDRLEGFNRLLHRHLEDEEEIVVPVILESGFRG